MFPMAQPITERSFWRPPEATTTAGMSVVAGPRPAPTPARGASADKEPPHFEIVIRPRQGWVAVDCRELYQARELLYFLAWRDVKIRYKQATLGVAWAVLQPLLTMVIFTMIFGRFARLPSDGIAYSVFVFAGLIPWTFFANGVSQGGQCLVNQQA